MSRPTRTIVHVPPLSVLTALATRLDDSIRMKQVRPVAFMVAEIEFYDLRSNSEVSGAGVRGLRGCWSAVSGQCNGSHNSALLMYKGAVHIIVQIAARKSGKLPCETRRLPRPLISSRSSGRPSRNAVAAEQNESLAPWWN